MPIRELRPERTTGHGIAEVIMSVLRGEQIKRQKQESLEEHLWRGEEHKARMGQGTQAELRAQRDERRQMMRDILDMAARDPSIFQSPEFEKARLAGGYPAMKAQPEQRIEDILGSPEFKGYKRPTVSVGPQGRVRGVSYAPKSETAQLPEEFKADLANAVSAIERGADRFKVYQRIAAEYPKLSTDIKRILLYTPADNILETFLEAIERMP